MSAPPPPSMMPSQRLATWAVSALLVIIAASFDGGGRYALVVDAAPLPLDAPVREDVSVVTLAGTGSEGAGNSANPTSATFRYPVGVAVTATGDVIVSDTENQVLRRVSRATGEVTTLAGASGSAGDSDGACGSAKFTLPYSIYADSRADVVYVADLASNMIREVTLTGGTCSVATLSGTNAPGARVEGSRAGSAPVASSGLCTPSYKPSCNPCSWIGIMKGRSIVDFKDGSDILYHFNPRWANTFVLENSLFSGTWESSTTYTALPTQEFSRQLFDLRVTATGFDSRYEGNAKSTYAHYRTPFEDYFTSWAAHSGAKAFQRCTTGANRNVGQAQLYSPAGIVRLQAGDLLITEKFSHAIRQVSLIGAGMAATVAGGATGDPGYLDHGDALAARYNAPLGLAELASGDVLVADEWNYRIRRLASSTRATTTFAGDGTCAHRDHASPLSARFCRPRSIAVDRKQVVYITDYVNHRIRRIDPDSSEVTTLAGSGSEGGSDHSSDPLLATFHYPTGLVYDPIGHTLIVTDQVGHRIRAVLLQRGLSDTLTLIPTPTMTSPTVSATATRSLRLTRTATFTATASAPRTLSATATPSAATLSSTLTRSVGTPSLSGSIGTRSASGQTPTRSVTFPTSSATSSASAIATATFFLVSRTASHTSPPSRSRSASRRPTPTSTLARTLSTSASRSGRSATQSGESATPSASCSRSAAATVSVSLSPTRSAGTATSSRSRWGASSTVGRSSRTMSGSASRPTASLTGSAATPSRGTATTTVTASQRRSRTTSLSSNVRADLLQATRPVVDVSALLYRLATSSGDTSNTSPSTTSSNGTTATIRARPMIELPFRVQQPWQLRRQLATVPVDSWVDAQHQQEAHGYHQLACLTVEISSNKTTVNVTEVARDMLERHVAVRAVNTTGVVVTLFAHPLPDGVSRKALHGLVVEVIPHPSCFEPDTITTAAVFRTVARDPPPPKTAIEKTTEEAQVGVDTVTVVSTLSGSPGGAIAAQRLGSLSKECSDDDDGGSGEPEAVPRAMNPTQAYVGDSKVRYYLGAALINPVVATAIVVLHVAAAVAYGRYARKPVRQTVLILRVTSGMCAIFLIAAQPTLEAAAVVLSEGLAGPAVGAAVVMLLFTILAGIVTYRYLWKDFAAAFAPGVTTDGDGSVAVAKADATDAEEEATAANSAEGALSAPMLDASNATGSNGSGGEPQRSEGKVKALWRAVVARFIAVVTPSGEWVVGDMTVEGLCDTRAEPAIYRTALSLPLYMDYNARGKYFMIVEFFVSALTGLGAAIELFAGCKIGALTVLIVLVAYVVLLFAMRPHAIPIDAVLAFALGIGQMIAAGTRTYFILSNRQVRGQSALAGMILVLQICAIMRGAFDFLNFCRKMRHFFDSERQKRLEAKLQASSAALPDKAPRSGGGGGGRGASTALDGLMATWNDEDDDGGGMGLGGDRGQAAVPLLRDADIDDEEDGAHHDVNGPGDGEYEEEEAEEEEVMDDEAEEDGASAVDIDERQVSRRDELLDALLAADADALHAAQASSAAADRATRAAERRHRRRQRRLAEGLPLSDTSSGDGSDDLSPSTTSTDGGDGDEARQTVVFGMLQMAGKSSRRYLRRKQRRQREHHGSALSHERGDGDPDALRETVSQALARPVVDQEERDADVADGSAGAGAAVPRDVSDALDALLLLGGDDDAAMLVADDDVSSLLLPTQEIVPPVGDATASPPNTAVAPDFSIL